MTRLLSVIVVIASTIVVVDSAGLSRWTTFRGPQFGVVDDDPSLPDTWSSTQNVVWKTPIAGRGWSSPIVWDDHVFVTTVLSDEPPAKPGLDLIEDGKNASYVGGNNQPIRKSLHRWVLYDLDFKTGKVRWERDLAASEPLAAKHPKNSYASETPVTDGTHVYVHNGDLGLFAVDFKGKVVWQTRVMPPNSLPGENPAAAKGRIDFGTASSPALYKDRIFVADDHEPREWFLAAYSSKTGQQLWRVGGAKSRPGGVWTGWSSPIVWDNVLRTEIIYLGGGSVRSFDVDGKPLWEMRGLSTNSSMTPVATRDMLYASSGYPADGTRPTWAIRPGASGDITLKDDELSSDKVAWYQPRLAAYIPSGLVYGKYVYTLASQGFFQANDATTGAPAYGRTRVDVAASGFSASPWAYNGKVFVLSEEGDTYVIQAGPEFKIMGKNSMGEMALATPAIVRGSLIFRTATALYRIAKTPQR